jgi:hypothetical protein
MPKNNRKSKSRKNRRSSTPNVFVQNRNIEDDDKSTQNTPSATPDSAAPRTGIRLERATRSASVRSEIYTRSQSAELKKLGVLTLGIIVILSVLTFVL